MKTKATEWFIMASGTLFMGGVGFLIATSLTKNKSVLTLASIAGLIIGASISAKAVQACKSKEEKQ
jgi:membrane-bound ClpP family serine protease